MFANTQNIAEQITVDRQNMYREETFSDLRMATIKRLTPMKTDGTPDNSREVLFIAQTQLLTNAGMLPITCQVEARTLDEAIEKFPDAIENGVKEMIEEAKEIQRQQSSRILVPDARDLGTLQQNLNNPNLGSKIIT
ncbi:MAG: hypothetical protein JW781_03480 [Deltaproteobacteria bacterium]|nr:hypothetical protein [Candidatus Anaeroferrophillacea bacterium]